MKMRITFCIVYLLIGLRASYCQKFVKKSLANGNISHIQIDVKNCFEISMATYDGNELVIEAKIDGEYEKDLLVKLIEKGSTLEVSAGFQPNFINPNDKLSAHKVLSIALRVLLPKQKKVHVFGTNCNVTATGTYDYLKVSLNDGRCDLIDVSEFAEVSTQSGPILAKYSHAVIEAKSKYGKVMGTLSHKGESVYDLSTVTGDILLQRVE